MVQPFPISVDFIETADDRLGAQFESMSNAALYSELGVEATLMGVGVDRVDYTKGILERFWRLSGSWKSIRRYQGSLRLCRSGRRAGRNQALPRFAGRGRSGSGANQLAIPGSSGNR